MSDTWWVNINFPVVSREAAEEIWDAVCELVDAHPEWGAAPVGMQLEPLDATDDDAPSDVAAGRQQALSGHVARFPDDQPDLAAVVRRRVSGTDHPAAHEDRLVAEAAASYTQLHPDWASSGDVDRAADQVLAAVRDEVDDE